MLSAHGRDVYSGNLECACEVKREIPTNQKYFPIFLGGNVDNNCVTMLTNGRLSNGSVGSPPRIGSQVFCVKIY